MHISLLFTVTQLVSPPDVFTPILKPVANVSPTKIGNAPGNSVGVAVGVDVGVGVGGGEVGDKFEVDVLDPPHDEMMAATRRAKAPIRAILALTLIVWSKTPEVWRTCLLSCG